MPSPTVLVAQPPPLPSGFELVGVQASDAGSIFELVSACDIAVLGRPDYSRDEVESDVGPLPSGAERPQSLVRRAATGEVVAWWWSDPRPGSSKFFADVYIHPDLAVADGDAIAESAWSTEEAWARHFYAGAQRAGADGARDAGDAEAEPELAVVSGSIHGDADGERRLRTAGFTHVRTFWRMTAPVPAAPLTTPPRGLTIVRATDLQLLHALREETFADHWGHEVETFEEWEARRTEGPGYDPSLWFIALLDAEPVGLLMCTRAMAEDDTLYVATLGTRTAYRRRGIAAALLDHAFAVARESGYTTARLNVDSDSPTGAPSVYRRAGYEVLFAMDAWRKPLSGALIDPSADPPVSPVAAAEPVGS